MMRIYSGASFLASSIPYAIVVACLLVSASAQAGPPDVTRFSTFVAAPPYSVLVQGRAQPVDLGGVRRFFDFGGDRPFVNAATGAPDVATFNAGVHSEKQSRSVVFSSHAVRDVGIPGRIEKRNGYTVVAYRAGDPPFAGRCRAQLSSFPVPSRRRLLWNLEFSLGANEAGETWPQTITGDHPVLLWQLKAPGLQPSLSMSVDEDPNIPGRLMLYFGKKAGFASRVTRVGSIGGLRRHELISVIMDSNLDERSATNGGAGFWHVWVNGRLVVDQAGSTLPAYARGPSQWYLSTYLYNDPLPLSHSRVVYWRTASMLK